MHPNKMGIGGSRSTPPPPPPRTNRTRRVPHPELIGHDPEPREQADAARPPQDQDRNHARGSGRGHTGSSRSAAKSRASPAAFPRATAAGSVSTTRNDRVCPCSPPTRGHAASAPAPRAGLSAPPAPPAWARVGVGAVLMILAGEAKVGMSRTSASTCTRRVQLVREEGTRRVRLVREEGTRRVQLVREGWGGGHVVCACVGRAVRGRGWGHASCAAARAVGEEDLMIVWRLKGHVSVEAPAMQLRRRAVGAVHRHRRPEALEAVPVRLAVEVRVRDVHAPEGADLPSGPRRVGDPADSTRLQVHSHTPAFLHACCASLLAAFKRPGGTAIATCLSSKGMSSPTACVAHARQPLSVAGRICVLHGDIVDAGSVPFGRQGSQRLLRPSRTVAAPRTTYPPGHPALSPSYACLKRCPATVCVSSCRSNLVIYWHSEFETHWSAVKGAVRSDGCWMSCFSMPISPPWHMANTVHTRSFASVRKRTPLSSREVLVRT